MPLYSFEILTPEHLACTPIELSMPMSEAVPAGETIDRFRCPRCATIYAEYVNGCPRCARAADAKAEAAGKPLPVGGVSVEHVKLRRLVERSISPIDDPFQVCRSVQMPRYHPDAPRVDKHGFPVLANRREVREFEAKTRGTAHEYHYD